MDMLQVLRVDADPVEAQLSPTSPHQMMTDTTYTEECRLKVRGHLAETFDTSKLQSAFDTLFDIVGHQQESLERLNRETAVLKRKELDRENEIRRLHGELASTKELAEKRKGIDGEELEALVRRASMSRTVDGGEAGSTRKGAGADADNDVGKDAGAASGRGASQGGDVLGTGGQPLTGIAGFSGLSLKRQPPTDSSGGGGGGGGGGGPSDSPDDDDDAPHPTIRSQKRPDDAGRSSPPPLDVAALARQVRRLSDRPPPGITHRHSFPPFACAR